MGSLRFQPSFSVICLEKLCSMGLRLSARSSIVRFIDGSANITSQYLSVFRKILRWKRLLNGSVAVIMHGNEFTV